MSTFSVFFYGARVQFGCDMQIITEYFSDVRQKPLFHIGYATIGPNHNNYENYLLINKTFSMIHEDVGSLNIDLEDHCLYVGEWKDLIEKKAKDLNIMIDKPTWVLSVHIEFP